MRSFDIVLLVMVCFAIFATAINYEGTEHKSISFVLLISVLLLQFYRVFFSKK